jgi:hypothetical protein
MKNQICEFEKAVIKESAGAVHNEKLALHIKQCADCREALKVAGWMRNFAADAAPRRNLPSAGFILWKSKIIEKQQAGRRAAQPIIWTQKGAILLAVIIMAWLAIQYQSKFETVRENFFASFELIAIPFLIAFICVAFICTVIAFRWRGTSRKN